MGLTPHTRRPIFAAVIATAGAIALSACAPVGAVPATAPATVSASPSASAPAAPSSSPSSEQSSVSPTPTQETTAPPSPSPSATSAPDALVVGANHIGSAASYVYPAKLVQQWLQGEVKPTEKIVFLTFDDGPNHKTTPVILEALKEADVHATFYVVGSMLDEAPELLKREVAEGNAINLHSWSHNYKKLYPKRHGNTEVIVDEYERTLAKVREILGPDFNTEGWRYPGGHMSWKGLADADAALASHGVSWVDWNADTADSAPKATRPTTIAGLVANATIPIDNGFHVAVVLGHDTPDKALTSQAVPAIIKAYKDAGYSFGVIS